MPAVMTMNKVILVGNLGADPEVRYTQGGDAVCNLRIATHDRVKDREGNWGDRTEWHRVVFFNRLAEIVEQYVKKGTKLYLEGRLQTRSYEQDGIKKYSTEIVANEMQMLDSRGAGQNQEFGDQPNAPTVSSSRDSVEGSAQQAPTNFDNFDDDIPF